ncbi:MAG: tripartite tricarboxylate transporter TctB family protein [Clostridia bacterium]|nr:tripartite tricarboxylate transporter TctB family protein [Clostridia bacterium]
MRKKNIYTSLVLLLLCVYSWFEVKDLPVISRYFPQVCIVFLALLSILLLIQALISPKIHEEKEKKNLKFVKIFAVGITAYILSIYVIGFNIGSALFLGTFGYWFNPAKDSKSIFYSFGIGIFVTALFYVIFGIIFNVPLPEGLIMEKLG